MALTPLVLTRDTDLAAEVSRLAAAAGVTPEVRGGTDDLLREWPAAPLVLVGGDVAADVAGADPPRRAAVHVVVRGRVPDALFRVALGLGAENVAALPESGTWLVELLTDLGEARSEPALTVGVVGGSGGAGATTFACALAEVAARQGAALLVDADPWGPGVDRVLGLDGLSGVGWESLGQTTGRLSARSLREAVPRRGELGVLTWGEAAAVPPPVFAVREALSAARRGHDVVVVDLPRATDPSVEEVLGRCDHVVLVAVGTVTGAAAAARIAARLRGLPASMVVRGTGVEPPDLARVTGLPVRLAMRDQRGLDEALDLGAGPLRARRGVLARGARTVLGDLRAVA